MSLLIHTSSRDCTSYLASAEIVCDLLLPAKTTVLEIWLPAEIVRVILLPAESRQEAISHGQSLQEAIYQAQQSQQEARDSGQSLCKKRKLADSSISCVI